MSLIGFGPKDEDTLVGFGPKDEETLVGFPRSGTETQPQPSFSTFLTTIICVVVGIATIWFFHLLGMS